MTIHTLPCLVRLALCAFVAACASLTSTTSIGAGQAFRLGGGQAGGFVVRGTNVGSVAVVVFSELSGQRDSIATVPPGAPVEARFAKSATAIFMNTSSTTPATVAIKVTGDAGGLSMTYEANPKR